MRSSKKRRGQPVHMCSISATYVPDEHDILLVGHDKTGKIWWSWFVKDNGEWTESERPLTK
jgi:hypothetical protein